MRNLSSRGFSFNDTDDKGNTPMHLLCANSEEVELIRFAIANGGNLSVQNKAGEDVCGIHTRA